MIHAKDVKEMQDLLDAGLNDLGREYGIDFSGVDPLKKVEKAAKVGEHFHANLGLDDDVMTFSIEVGQQIGKTLGMIAAFMDLKGLSDEHQRGFAEALLGGYWLKGLITGVALGRKFPKS